MAEPTASQPLTAPSNRPSSSDSPTTSTSKRPSTLSLITSLSSRGSISPPASPPGTLPRVQLIPHIQRLSYDSSLSQSERDLLDNTSFDALDLSSKDFDFEEIFTYDKPQRQLPSVVEVSSPSRERDRINSSFSHYTLSAMGRPKTNRSRSGKGEMYVKNKSDARKR